MTTNDKPKAASAPSDKADLAASPIVGPTSTNPSAASTADSPDASSVVEVVDTAALADAKAVSATTSTGSAAGDAAETPNPKASHADRVKFVGLIAFFVVMVVAVAFMWPYISMVFEPGGLEHLTEMADGAGWGGVLLLEAFQFLQIVVAFIPGEVTQIAAGMLYGPWAGAAIILVGCVISSAFIFLLVHKLGAPFVHDMVPAKYMDKFRSFEKSGRFELVVFILFLIPGLPKDVFTYLTPLSDMKLVPFLLITNLARIPGIVISTYAADGLMEGRVFESVVMFLVLAAVAGVALLVYNRISAQRHPGDSSRIDA